MRLIWSAIAFVPARPCASSKFETTSEATVGAVLSNKIDPPLPLTLHQCAAPKIRPAASTKPTDQRRQTMAVSSDRRLHAPRLQTNLKAQIVLRLQKVIPCFITEISPAGARLTIGPHQDHLPSVLAIQL